MYLNPYPWRWEDGQPDNLNKSEHCLAVNIQQSAFLRDENCDLKMRYICEVSRKNVCIYTSYLITWSDIQARLSSGAKAVEVECGNTFNLSSGKRKKTRFYFNHCYIILFLEQITNLMTRLPEILEEKCFIKCFGEGTDMVIHNSYNFNF